MEILGTFPREFCFPKSRINENGGKVFREEATSAGLHADPISWSNWNLVMLVFFVCVCG